MAAVIGWIFAAAVLLGATYIVGLFIRYFYYEARGLPFPHQKKESDLLGIDPKMVPRDPYHAESIMKKARKIAERDLRQSTDDAPDEEYVGQMSSDEALHLSTQYSEADMRFLIAYYDHYSEHLYSQYTTMKGLGNSLMYARQERIARMEKHREARRSLDDREDMDELERLVADEDA